MVLARTVGIRSRGFGAFRTSRKRRSPGVSRTPRENKLIRIETAKSRVGACFLLSSEETPEDERHFPLGDFVERKSYLPSERREAAIRDPLARKYPPAAGRDRAEWANSLVSAHWTASLKTVVASIRDWSR
jgi:hypothetical protein